MGRVLGTRHLARLSTRMAVAVLLCVTGTPVVQQLVNTSDGQARPRARVSPDLLQAQLAVDVPDRALPWLTDLPATDTSRDGADRSGSKQDGQEITGPKGTRVWVPSLLTDTGVPYAASRAYHHAANTMATVDPACRIPWTLLAAIGRVESDHGQYGGAVLDAKGVPHPAIFGVPLERPGPGGGDPGHRQRSAGPRHGLGPGRGPDAVPAQHLADVGPGR